MSSSALFLGLDVGTQGCKAIVYNAKENKVVSRGAYSYDILKSDVPGRAEQHPSLWIEASAPACAALNPRCASSPMSHMASTKDFTIQFSRDAVLTQGGVAALNQALDSIDRKNVKALSISGQQHGFVPVDKHGQVIRNAKLWCDVESVDEARRLSKEWNWTLVPGFTASKILWLKDREPENFSKLSKVLLPHDYFNYYLTGRYCMEAGDASGTGLFDTANRTYDQKRLGSIDSALEDKFPQLIGPNEVVGTLRAEVAKELGLTPDVQVAPGSGDNQMSALGAGAVHEGTWVMSLGTSGTLFGLSTKPILDPSGAVSPFCDATGSWLPLLCTMNCTTVTEEVRKGFGMDHETITQLAEKEAAGSSGVNFLPYITGERTPNWPHSSGVITGLRPGGIRPGLLYRAAMEGATFSLLAGLKKMEGYGVKASEIRVVGGGSKNRLWRRIIADSFQLPLKFPTEPESAALGAALQAAAVHAGVATPEFIDSHSPPLADTIIQPDPSKKQAYEEAFQRHYNYGNQLFESEP